MRKLFAVAAFLLASTAAQAQYTFEYGGRTIRIDPDRGTISIPGVYDNTGKRSKRPRNDQDSERSRKPASEQAKVEPQAPTAAPAPTEPAPAAAVSAPSEPSTTTARVAPSSDTITSTQPPTGASTPQVQPDGAPAVRPAAPVVATAPASAPIQSQPVPAPTTTAAQSANSPLGTWLTEEKEGKVRIEPCGTNLCGYSVDKSNQNAEKILINMKPGKDSKWSGRIFDPNSGSTYDSTIALKGSDSLRVQGCAFGGMFCGGQTWTRLN